MGASLVRGSARNRRRTSRPSTLGSFKSSKVTCGMSLVSRPVNLPLPPKSSRASAPSRTTTTSLVMLFFLRARKSRLHRPDYLPREGSLVFARIAPFQECRSSNAEIKCGTFFNLGFSPYITAMTTNDPLNRGQPDARTGEFIHAVKTLKSAKEAVGILGIETGSVVSHVENRFTTLFAPTEFNASLIVARGVFPCIAQQIFSASGGVADGRQSSGHPRF